MLLSAAGSAVDDVVIPRRMYLRSRRSRLSEERPANVAAPAVFGMRCGRNYPAASPPMAGIVVGGCRVVGSSVDPVCLLILRRPRFVARRFSYELGVSYAVHLSASVTIAVMLYTVAEKGVRRIRLFVADAACPRYRAGRRWRHDERGTSADRSHLRLNWDKTREWGSIFFYENNEACGSMTIAMLYIRVFWRTGRQLRLDLDGTWTGSWLDAQYGARCSLIETTSYWLWASFGILYHVRDRYWIVVCFTASLLSIRYIDLSVFLNRIRVNLSDAIYMTIII